jgi:uncharacterized membrane protein YhaH (DUF805 family)
MPQVIRILEVLIYSGTLSMKSQSSKIFDWWWVVLLVIVVIGLVTSNQYVIMAGLVVVLVAAILTFTIRRRWTAMSSQKV